MRPFGGMAAACASQAESQAILPSPCILLWPRFRHMRAADPGADLCNLLRHCAEGRPICCYEVHDLMMLTRASVPLIFTRPPKLPRDHLHSAPLPSGQHAALADVQGSHGGSCPEAVHLPVRAHIPHLQPADQSVRIAVGAVDLSAFCMHSG